MNRLAGRTCLITGASSGFGAHFARLFVAEGARVIVGARRAQKVEALAAEIREAGGEALAVEMDVTDEPSTIAAFDAAEAAFGTVDTVVANAGIASTSRATDVPVSDMRALVETNLIGAMLTAREGAKRMMAAGSRETGRGRVLIIGSMAAQVTLPGQAIYCASKAAVAHLARCLSAEWVRMGVNINVIQPGYVRTGINDAWFDSEGGQTQIGSLARKRLQPIESLNEPAIYFCSDASASTTGSVLTVDDGQAL
jgi:NAD(P)-dependent dehydrogenase (short-subunit alcohol dehydrogenase family)